MEKNGPLISVIVPVYDVGKYLSKCLDSLLAQTWRNLEIIVVDDGSPDGSWDIMQDYAARDSRVRIFRKKNGGVSAARNFGMDAAEGEYLGFVDPDDWCRPTIWNGWRRPCRTQWRPGCWWPVPMSITGWRAAPTRTRPC